MPTCMSSISKLVDAKTKKYESIELFFLLESLFVDLHFLSLFFLGGDVGLLFVFLLFPLFTLVLFLELI